MNKKEFQDILRQKVLILDGAMGTMVQRRLPENKLLNDLLAIENPETISSIHRDYIEAGADIISTDTFNANALSLADYGMEDRVREINIAAARLARREADAERERPGRRVLVAGSMGPTPRSASLSPDVDDPAARNVTFDMLSDAYAAQAEALIEGGADILLFETAFDTLNLKAGLDGARRAFQATGKELAVMVSATLADRGGHTLSGQTLEAFLISLNNDPLIASAGLNCSFGPEEMIPFLERLSEISSFPVSCHPNAGLPDECGNYKETPEHFCSLLAPLLEEGKLNIVGGCCGTTPDHIRRLASPQAKPRPMPATPALPLLLSGLEPFDSARSEFGVVGERCNVAGSRKFLRLIKEGNFDEALSIAARQVEDGAMIIDINMDDPLLDAPVAMVRFLNLAAADPAISRVPFMIDSSDFEVIERALKCMQGKGIVNSISLKEGEEEFLRRARRIRELGAAMVVMAFDETGQADTFERKCEVCARAYTLLTEKAGVRPEDIIFDPNVMAVATGIEEHNLYARDFIRAARFIKETLPGAKVSGGVSNLSFAFRGKNRLRESMHSVFLYHARKAGMDMAIVNPAAMLAYEDVEPRLREILDDLMLNGSSEAAEKLAEYALASEGDKPADSAAKAAASAREEHPADPAESLKYGVIHGVSDSLQEDIRMLTEAGKSPVEIINGELMQAMEHVGRLFGEGKMFLPQVVKTARTMKRAVEILRPMMDADASGEKTDKAGRVLIVTVKGDVHDIGKNIVSIVLECNNFEVTDLGVMVPPEKILEETKRLAPDVVCLSGLITPSLGEMARVIEIFENEGLRVPVLVGGAATSALHTALRLAPLYSGIVAHARDASQNPLIISSLTDESKSESYAASIRAGQQHLRLSHSNPDNGDNIEAARRRKVRIDWSAWKPTVPECGAGRDIRVHIPLAEIIPLIQWEFLYMAWRVNGNAEESASLRADAEKILAALLDENPGCYGAEGVVRFEVVNSDEEDIIGSDWRMMMPRRLKPDHRGESPSLADFIMPASEGRKDIIGMFAVTSGLFIGNKPETDADSYGKLLRQTLSDRLAEAASEWLHREVRTHLWGYAKEEELSAADLRAGRYQGIRPAVGYPSLPDQRLIFSIASRMNLGSIGVTLTGNGAMSPASSICGLYLSHPSARYF